MENITYTSLRQNLSSIMNIIEDDSIVYKITRKDHKNLIMMTEDDYNSMDETMHLLSSPANAARLYEAMEEVKKGDFVEVNLDDEDYLG